MDPKVAWDLEASNETFDSPKGRNKKILEKSDTCWTTTEDDTDELNLLNVPVNLTKEKVICYAFIIS